MSLVIVTMWLSLALEPAPSNCVPTELNDAQVDYILDQADHEASQEVALHLCHYIDKDGTIQPLSNYNETH